MPIVIDCHIRDPLTAARPHLSRNIALSLCGAFLLFAYGCMDNTQSQLAEIRSLQSVSQFDDSIAPLRKLIAKDPDHPEANYRLGIALAQTGRSSLAVWPLKRASESEEYGIHAGLFLASTLAKNGSNEEAVRASSRVIELDNENISALMTRGATYLKMGHPELAIVDAETILKLQPEDHAATALRGSALIDLDRGDEAEAQLRSLVSRAESGENPSDAGRKCASLAVFYRTQKDDERAKETFNGCLEKYPAHGMVLQFASDFFLETKDTERAIQLWRSAVETTPEDIRRRAQLASLLEQHNRAEEALIVFQETVDLFDTSQAWQLLSDFQRQSGNPTAAREAFQEALDRMPQITPALQFKLADLLIHEGNYEAAEKIAKNLKESSYTHFIKGSLLLHQDQFEGALAAFDDGLRLWPNNAGVRYMAGIASTNLDKKARSLEEFREAIRVDEEATDASLRMAEIYFHSGDYAAAKGFAHRHIRNRPLGDGSAYLISIRSSNASQDFDRARVTAERLLSLMPANQAVQLEYANVLRLSEGPNASLDFLLNSSTDLTKLDNFEVLQSISADYLALEQVEQAVKAVDSALANHPKNIDLLVFKGRLLSHSANSGQAEKVFDAALAIDPVNPGALEARAQLHLISGNLEAAQDLLERAAKHDPTEADYVYALGQINLTRGNEAGAEVAYRKALDLKTEHVGANNDLAWILASNGRDLSEALKMAKIAVRWDRNADTLDTLGFVHLKNGDPEQAVRVLDKALLKRPDSPSIEYRLGLALVATGETDKAKLLLQKALQNSAFPERERARAELAKLQES